MSQPFAFTVRNYPSFRPARLFRVVFSPEAIYLIQMKGLLSQADAGGDYYTSGLHHGTGLQKLMAQFILHSAGQSIARGVQEVDGADPKELVRRHKKNLCLTREEFASSTLDPPSFFGGHGVHYAQWKFVLKDGRKMAFQVEDVDDLKAAIASLPEFLGSTHKNQVRWDEASQAAVKTS